MGLFWGWFTQDMHLAVSLALVFELFWLDLIPAGTFIPPQAAAAAMGCLFLASYHGLHDPLMLCLPVLLSLPLAFIGTSLENLRREQQNRNYNALLKGARTPGSAFPAPRLVAHAAGRTFVENWLFLTVSLAVLNWVAGMLLPTWVRLAAGRELPMAALWLGASIGCVLSLRIRRAYAVLAVCLVAGVAIFFS